MDDDYSYNNFKKPNKWNNYNYGKDIRTYYNKGNEDESNEGNNFYKKKKNYGNNYGKNNYRNKYNIGEDDEEASYQQAIENKKKYLKRNYYGGADRDEENEKDDSYMANENNKTAPNISFNYNKDNKDKEQVIGFKSATDFGKKDNAFDKDKKKDNNINNQPEEINEELLKERKTFKKFIPPKAANSSNNIKCREPKEKAGGGPNDSDEEDSRIKGIDKKLVSFVEGEILQSNPNVKWDDIAGLDFAKNTIKEIIIWPLLRPDIFKGIRRPPKGLLLFGPPGTGKTMIAKAIASEAKAKFFNISASSLTSKWIGESEKLARCLFALASFHQPSVIFIDEIDSILSARQENENESSRRLKTEFLVQLDGAGTNQSDAILIIGATNRPQEIDDAVIRRMTKRLYIPLPNHKSRKELIENVVKSETDAGSKYFLSEKKPEINPKELKTIIKNTNKLQ